MFKVIGKILIFVFGICLLVTGVAELVYLVVQYATIFDPLHIALTVIQGVTAMVCGISSIFLITRSKNPAYVSISTVILFGLGVYFLAIFNGSIAPAYYLAVGIINIISTSFIMVSLIWNRKK